MDELERFFDTFRINYTRHGDPDYIYEIIDHQLDKSTIDAIINLYKNRKKYQRDKKLNDLGINE